MTHAPTSATAPTPPSISATAPTPPSTSATAPTLTSATTPTLLSSPVSADVAPLAPSVPSRPRSLRARVPWWSLIGIVMLVLLTLGNAAANMMPFHVPTAYELQQAEQHELARARRERVDALIAEGDRCRPHVAHEIARGLVYVGRSARAYAADYQQRCGADPIVERWGNAPLPRRKV